MKPLLSVVLVVFNIPLQLNQTLASLRNEYQGLPHDFYEVIIVDNGSSPPVDPAFCSQFGFSFRMLRVAPAPASPAYAINLGLAAARGEVIGVMIDGARMLSPGLLRFAADGVSLRERSVVFTLGYYLGFDYQSFAMHWGDHDGTTEADLLRGINWPEDGYRLFEIATPDESSGGSGLMPLGESNALFMHASLWRELGGADERFAEAGGGLLNIDLYKRALTLPGVQPVVLLGEGTFHQAHGGTATNTSPDTFNDKLAVWRATYERITGKELAFPPDFPGRRPIFLGSPRPPALTRLSCDHMYTLGLDIVTPLLVDRLNETPGDPADPRLALIEAAVRAGDLTTAIYIARLARRDIADTAFTRTVFSYLPGAFDPRTGELHTRAPKLQATIHTNVGRLQEASGRPDLATESFERALAVDPSWVDAHLGLSRVRLPGPFYYEWLDTILETLRPAVVLEIGVFDGESLARYQPPTQVIAIDPVPRALFSLSAPTFVFPEESDVFFDRLPARAASLPAGIDYAFIDGLHTFPQALKDFMNCEAYANPGAVFVLHDTIPLNEVTQRAERETGFHTGDVWKVVVYLMRHRPDLVIWTLPCAPSGLTMISGLDRTNRVLQERYDEVVAEFDAMPYSDIAGRESEMLNIKHLSKAELAALLIRRLGNDDAVTRDESPVE